MHKGLEHDHGSAINIEVSGLELGGLKLGREGSEHRHQVPRQALMDGRGLGFGMGARALGSQIHRTPTSMDSSPGTGIEVLGSRVLKLSLEHGTRVLGTGTRDPSTAFMDPGLGVEIRA